MDDPDCAVPSLLPSVSALYCILVKSYLKKTLKDLIRSILASGYLAYSWDSTTRGHGSLPCLVASEKVWIAEEMKGQ